MLKCMAGSAAAVLQDYGSVAAVLQDENYIATYSYIQYL